jgi:hypothetical protein
MLFERIDPEDYSAPVVRAQWNSPEWNLMLILLRTRTSEVCHEEKRENKDR